MANVQMAKDSSTKKKCPIVMGTVAHHRKREEIYNLRTIPTQENLFKT